MTHIFLDIVILNSDFNSASSTPACTMFKGSRPAKAVWEHFVKLESNGKLIDASSVVTRCHPNVIQCNTKCSNSDSTLL